MEDDGVGEVLEVSDDEVGEVLGAEDEGVGEVGDADWRSAESREPGLGGNGGQSRGSSGGWRGDGRGRCRRGDGGG